MTITYAMDKYYVWSHQPQRTKYHYFGVMVHIPNVDDNAQNKSMIMIRIMLWVHIQVFDYNFFW